MDPISVERTRGNGSPGISLLRANLEYDAGACELVRLSRRIPLTSRECELLAELLRAPGRFLSSAHLSQRLSRPNDYPIDDHSIRQTICDLRQKLGESAQRQRLLRTKRKVGYGIFPEAPKTPNVPTR